MLTKVQNIMNYDVYGPSYTSSTGPNSPLDGSCGNPRDNTVSLKTAASFWHSAGFDVRPKLAVCGLQSF